MAGKVDECRLSTRVQRQRLPARAKPYWREVRLGLHLGLLKREAGRAMRWIARRSQGAGTGKYVTTTLGTVDDERNAANRRDVLDYEQAVAKATAWAEERGARPNVTVAVAAQRYADHLENHGKGSAYDTRRRLERLVISQPIGRKLVSKLSRSDVERWLNAMVRKEDDPERVRKSRDSANRTFTMLKAALNSVAEDAANDIPRDHRPWSDVKAFRNVARAREHHFTPEEARRLIAQCPEPFFRNLLAGALLLGCRYGELVVMDCRHFDAARRTLTVPSGKTGRRVFAVSTEAAALLSKLVEGREPDAPLFERTGGGRWKKSDEIRRMATAVAAAQLGPGATFYSCRHTYASRAIEAGVPLLALAKAMGTSTTMLERTYTHILVEREREFAELAAMKLGFTRVYGQSWMLTRAKARLMKPA